MSNEKKRKLVLTKLLFPFHNDASRGQMPLPGLPGVSDDRLFQVLNLCLVGWFLLALPPGWRPRLWEQAILALCGFFGTLYALTLLHAVATGAVPANAGFDSLDGVVALFSSRPVVLSGWTHYVCHDLLAGLFAAKDAQRLGIPHFLFAGLVLPLLLLAGPAGLAAHLVLARVAAPDRARRATPNDERKHE